MIRLIHALYLGISGDLARNLRYITSVLIPLIRVSNCGLPEFSMGMSPAGPGFVCDMTVKPSSNFHVARQKWFSNVIERCDMSSFVSGGKHNLFGAAAIIGAPANKLPADLSFLCSSSTVYVPHSLLVEIG
jgi:hypothetical protein